MMKLQFNRNNQIFDSKDLAVKYINGQTSKFHDGEPMLARFYTDDTKQEIRTLMAVRHDVSGSRGYTMFEMERGASVHKLTQEEVVALQEENVLDAYKLVDNDGKDLSGDIIKIYKDQSLKNVYLDGTTLVFEYEIKDGGVIGKKDIRLDMSQIISEATYGNGLKKNESGAVEVNVAPGPQNFLTTEGEDGKKSLAVRSLDGDKTYLRAAIKVSGGPLSDALNDAGIYKIDANTDIQSLMEKLLFKEVYPTTTTVHGKLNANLDGLTISFVEKTNGGLAEIGQLLTLNTVTAKQIVANTNTYNKVSGFTYGYSDSNNNTAIQPIKNIIEEKWYGVNESGNYSLEPTVTGFNNAGLTVAPASTNYSSVQITANSKLKVEVGTNKISVKETSAAIIGNVKEIPSYFIVSNAGKTSASYMSTSAQSQNARVEPIQVTSHSAVITGVYPVYSNINGPTLNSEANQKVPLTSGNEVLFENAPGETSEIHLKFRYPASKVGTLLVKGLRGDFVPFDGKTSTQSVTVTINQEQLEYTELTTVGAEQGSATYKIKLNSNLSEK